MENLPVIDLITKSIEGGFDTQELQNIEENLRDLSRDKLEKAVNEIKKLQIGEPAKAKLLELLNEISNPDFGFEGLKEGSTSEFFGLVLKKPGENTVENALVGQRFLALNIAITKLSTESLGAENNELFSSSKETLNLVIWNILVSQIGLKSGGAYMVETMKNKVMGPLNSLKGAFSGTNETQPAEEELGDIGKLLNAFQDVSTAANSDDTEKVEGLSDKLNTFLEFIVRDEYKNLNDFCNLAKEKKIQDSPNFKKLLEDPQLLSEVMKNGVYNNGNIKIDIENKIIEGGVTNEELKENKISFMKEVIKNTNGTGENMDGMKNKFTKMAKMFDKIGLSSDDLNSMVEDLKSIPVIGDLLAVLLNFFMGENVMDELDKIQAEKKYKKVVKTFFEVGKTQDNILFKAPEKQDKESLKTEGENIALFLTKIESLEKDYNINKEAAAQINNSFADKDLWTILLGTKLTENIILLSIKKQIQSIDTKSATMTQVEFTTKLSVLSLNMPVKVVNKTPADTADKGVDAANKTPADTADKGVDAANKTPTDTADKGVDAAYKIVDAEKKKLKIPTTPKIIEVPILSIVDTIQKSTHFPIILPDGREINYDEQDYLITIGNENFGISSADIAGNKVDGWLLSGFLLSQSPNLIFTNNMPIVTISGNESFIPVNKFKQLLLDLEKNKTAILDLGDKKITFS